MKNLTAGSLFVLFFLIGLGTSHAQWVATNGPFGGPVTCFALRGTTLFAGTKNSGVFSSPDSGATWKPISSGLPNKQINIVAAIDSTLIVGTWDGLFMSDDNGTSWMPMNNG
jgi:hypothetical protein